MFLIIGPVMPWRTQNSIYNRAHILYQRADKREWTPEEKEALRKYVTLFNLYYITSVIDFQ